MMTPDEIAPLLLSRYGVRAEAATRAYVATQVAGGRPFPILAGCARTGRPLSPVVVPAELAAAQAGAAR